MNAKIDPCGRTKTILADIHLILGWNFIQSDDYHVGLGLRLVAPTGTRPGGEFFFEPIVGNGKHWEIGMHFTSHANLWENECEDSFLDFYVDANLTHMIKARQTRTFDLKGKPFSRYMMAVQFGKPDPVAQPALIKNLSGQNASDPAPIFPNSQFLGVFAPVANISTQEVYVAIGLQADVVAQLTFSLGNHMFDVGYNFWATTCEKISSDCQTTSCPLITFDDDMWALKGDEQLYGFARTADPVAPVLFVNEAVELSATENNATINAGTNYPAAGTTNAAVINVARTNPNIDNPKPAQAGGSNTPLFATPNPSVLADRINTSIQPVLIKAGDLDLVGTRGLSHKIYAHYSYNWLESDYVVPFLGVGGFAEFGSSGCNKKCAPSCATTSSNCGSDCRTSCFTCSLSQWGMWIKGGFSF